jgi:hypothetical protein
MTSVTTKQIAPCPKSVGISQIDKFSDPQRRGGRPTPSRWSSQEGAAVQRRKSSLLPVASSLRSEPSEDEALSPLCEYN